MVFMGAVYAGQGPGARSQPENGLLRGFADHALVVEQGKRLHG
jgi:hypothetical protein